MRLSRGVTGWLAFAPDSRTAIYGDGAGTLILAKVESGRELARFEDPEQVQAGAVAFTPDGSQVVATLADRPYLRVWDLRAIRRRLDKLQLDWDTPATFDSPDTPSSLPPMPKAFRVDRGELDSSLAEASLKRLEEALADHEKALQLKPDHADGQRLALLCNNLAWRLATSPSSTRDPSRAMHLARRAVALTPDRAIYLNTLGVAQYRASRHAEAIVTLGKSLAASKGGSDGFDLFFLAMARHKLGEIDRARADFDLAVKWWREHPQQTPQWTEELKAFKAEAEAVLASPPGELPAELFAPVPEGRP